MGNFGGPRRASAKLLDIDIAQLKAGDAALGSMVCEQVAACCSRCNRPKSMPPRVAISPAAFPLRLHHRFFGWDRQIPAQRESFVLPRLTRLQLDFSRFDFVSIRVD